MKRNIAEKANSIDNDKTSRKVVNMNSYGKKLKYMIKNSGYTQKELAALLNVSESTLSRWVLKEAPELEGVIAVCKTLNVPLSKFFSDPKEEIIALTAAEKEMLDLFAKLPADRQQALIEFIRRWK